MGVPRLGQVPRRGKPPAWPGGRVGKVLGQRPTGRGRSRIFQFPPVTGLRQVPAAETDEGTRPGQRRGGRASLRQWLDNLRDLPGRSGSTVAWPSARSKVRPAIICACGQAARQLHRLQNCYSQLLKISAGRVRHFMRRTFFGDAPR